MTRPKADDGATTNGEFWGDEWSRGASSRCLVDIAREGALVTAVDHSPVGVREARKMFNGFGIDGQVIEAGMFTAGPAWPSISAIRRS